MKQAIHSAFTLPPLHRKYTDPPSFPLQPKLSQELRQRRAAREPQPMTALNLYFIIIIILILHTWTQRSPQRPGASPLERISTPHSEGKHRLLSPPKAGCLKQTGTELATNRIRINCFKLTFRSERPPPPLQGRAQGCKQTSPLQPHSQSMRYLHYSSQQVYYLNHG